MNVEGNKKADASSDIPTLITAAEKLRDMVKQMESGASEIKGFIVYR